MSPERHVQALLDLVAADRGRKCDAILAEARAQAGALLRQAHADASERMRRAFVEERERHDARVGAARANLQTKRRLALQRREHALLAAGAMRLPPALVRRWESAAGREPWVAAAVANARNVLPRGRWRILHAPHWPASERDSLAAELAAVLGAAPSLVEEPGLRAGLRISADGNVIDGTLDGLLADRAEIGARLLQLLEAKALP
jgi:hypothetical protein